MGYLSVCSILFIHRLHLKLAEIVEVCVRNKTHYVDLTGEPLFIKHLVDNFHADAVKSQVAIVPSTGFDSMPFDLCVYLIAEELAKSGLKVGEVRTHLRAAKGGVSGGTIASMAHMFTLPIKDLKVVGDPYCLADSSRKFTLLLVVCDPHLRFRDSPSDKARLLLVARVPF